jgi:transposase
MSISEHKHMSSDEPARVQRFEVFTGAGRRRAWSPEEKAAIVAESLLDGETVCGVARRHGLTPQQLFTWRRQARVTTDEDGLADGPAFLPAIVAAEPPVAEGKEPVRRRGRPRGRKEPGLIEVEIGGATVRVGRGAEAKALTAILLALKVQP